MTTYNTISLIIKDGNVIITISIYTCSYDTKLDGIDEWNTWSHTKRIVFGQAQQKPSWAEEKDIDDGVV